MLDVAQRVEVWLEESGQGPSNGSNALSASSANEALTRRRHSSPTIPFSLPFTTPTRRRNSEPVAFGAPQPRTPLSLLSEPHAPLNRSLEGAYDIHDVATAATPTAAAEGNPGSAHTTPGGGAQAYRVPRNSPDLEGMAEVAGHAHAVRVTQAEAEAQAGAILLSELARRMEEVKELAG